jgi:hypothetical protein
MPFFGVPIRNGLPIGLGSSAGFGVQPFDPSYLFAAGEQGAWYDPSDYSTLFEESTGTTPVTGVEQFVGLMLDKSGRGNHATQTNSLKRPKLAARYNLLTYTEQFDNAAWATASRVTITANTTATLDPLGGTTADIMTEVALTGTHRVEQVNVPNSLTTIANTFSCYFKLPSGATRNAALFFTDSGGSNQCRGFFDLTTLAASSSVVGSSVVSGVSITPVGNGWLKCSLTGVVNSSGTAYAYVAMSDGTNTSYLGDTGESIYIWGADLRPASQATGLIGPTYQRVAAATVYDTAGFLPYLEFNGMWSMSTNSIDFSAGDKMTVWAGVRKLSDAAAAIIVEDLSPDVNDGSFSFAASGTDGVNRESWAIAIRGTTNQAVRQPRTYIAPVTSVLSFSLNTGAATTAAQIVPRVNGATPSIITDVAGPTSPGNFSNRPIYIGARGGTSFYFTGWLTSLIVRGAQSTQSQIEATEAWVNSRTGAY